MADTKPAPLVRYLAVMAAYTIDGECDNPTALSDEMGDLWDRLTPEEREFANAVAQEILDGGLGFSEEDDDG